MPGLTTFKDFLKDFKSLSSVTSKTAAAAPLADYFVKIGPPWPPYTIPAATTIVELVCLICIFQFWRLKSVSTVNRDLIISIIVFCLSTFIYLGVSSSYTFRHPKTGELIIKGYNLTPATEEVIRSDYTVEDALKGNSYDPEGVWTNSSITVMRLLLVGLWVLMFISLSSFFGMFVIVQHTNVTSEVSAFNSGMEHKSN